MKSLGKKRKLSPYNIYMKSEITKIKAKYPNIGHKEAFKLAAGLWRDSPENPKVLFYSS
ncbi:hypothetical protein C1645_685405 [Glomus cerebriforme]|uniref:HMG box domain-containing protein n=1 Tax=Glomus cerebriforme TaxID=658196 RepID=A0A397TMY5_9GLOM|nr:hypothetical protein C1645_685405 [Glomus cerebriforme]